jgi:phosphate transport system ATP-binding protein
MATLETVAVESERTATTADPGEIEAPVGPRLRTDIRLNRPKITIRDLDFYYGGTQALKGVSLDLPEKQATGLIGPSGCGKSTLLRVLNRLYDLYPDQRATGDVRIDGQDMIGPEVDIGRLRSRIGMVFQEPTPFPMSIFANIAFGVNLYWKLSHRELGERVEEALTRADLWTEVKDRLSAAAQSLSGGQQQRLCIARALAVRPEVILLDEPTSALDPIAMNLIENLIIDLKRDLTVVLVTHNMQQAARCADQVAFFYLGELVEVGPTARMFTAPREVRTEDYVTGRFG